MWYPRRRSRSLSQFPGALGDPEPSGAHPQPQDRVFRSPIRSPVRARLNGQRLVVSNDQAYELVMAVAAGQLDDLNVIADHLRRGSRPKP